MNSERPRQSDQVLTIEQKLEAEAASLAGNLLKLESLGGSWSDQWQEAINIVLRAGKKPTLQQRFDTLQTLNTVVESVLGEMESERDDLPKTSGQINYRQYRMWLR